MFACADCGHRQAAAGACSRCQRDPVLDLAKPETAELLFDIEQRLRQRREGRIRFGAVVVAVALMFALWLVPGYWSVRAHFALPFWADQFAIMIAVGLGLMKLLEHGYRSKRRFPYVNDEGKLI